MTALDLIKGALRRINSYQSGEQIAAPDSADCLEALNDLLDSWSTDKLHIFGSNENIFNWSGGKNQYSVGNPTCTSLGKPAIPGTLAIGSNLIGTTGLPIDLKIGATLTDSANVIPQGTVVTAITGTTITMSQNATATPAIGLDQVTYTIPGDFAIPRPLRITGGFTRISQLDFWLDVYATQEQYTAILFKAQPGPWPTVAWYNPQMPYGLFNVYQTPGNGAEVHLFTDTILANLTLTQTFVLPQGYSRALKWCLAQEISAEYGYPESPAIKKRADDSLKMIKALNERPAQKAVYDRQLLRGNRPDGGWIFHGGMN
jgi:hypothetical protein